MKVSYTMVPRRLLDYHYLGANLQTKMLMRKHFGCLDNQNAERLLTPRNRFLPDTLGRGQAFGTMDTFTNLGKPQTC